MIASCPTTKNCHLVCVGFTLFDCDGDPSDLTPCVEVSVNLSGTPDPELTSRATNGMIPLGDFSYKIVFDPGPLEPGTCLAIKMFAKDAVGEIGSVCVATWEMPGLCLADLEAIAAYLKSVRSCDLAHHKYWQGLHQHSLQGMESRFTANEVWKPAGNGEMVHDVDFCGCHFYQVRIGVAEEKPQTKCSCVMPAQRTGNLCGVCGGW